MAVRSKERKRENHQVATHIVCLPYENGGGTREIAGRPATTLDILLVRVDTDEGLTGWGEAFGHAAVPAHAACSRPGGAALVGRDARDIARSMQELSQRLHLFGRNGPVVYALSGVDIALWDIAGKTRRAAAVPAARRRGARRCSAYASLLRYGEPDAVARNACEAARRGYRDIKLHEITEP